MQDAGVHVSVNASCRSCPAENIAAMIGSAELESQFQKNI
jgi:hypothetical protein